MQDGILLLPSASTTLCYQLQPAINDLYDSIALFLFNVMSCVIALKQAYLTRCRHAPRMKLIGGAPDISDAPSIGKY